MLGVRYGCWAAAALICGGDVARANELESLEDPLTVELSNRDARIEEAHAQFGEVVAPPSLPGFGDGLGDLLSYSGVDGWRHGGSVYTGADWTNGIFVVRLFGSYGLDNFRAGSVAYLSETARASFMPGLRLQSGKLDLKFFIGGDYMVRVPQRPTTDPAIQQIGARFTIDAWWEPEDAWMLSAALSATTIEQGIAGRLASGWRASFGWIGPEVLATHDLYSTQVRAGAHVSSIKFGATEWSIAGGYARDSFGRQGPYGRLSLTFRP